MGRKERPWQDVEKESSLFLGSQRVGYKEDKMKKSGTLVAVIFIISLFVATESFAQRGMRWQGSGAWGRGTQYGKMYDPGTVETISGEVVSIEHFTPMRGMHHGVHMMVKTDKETVSVHLGPVWYIENQDVKIEPKERVEVKGSRIDLAGEQAIIASEVRKGDQVLKLRDEDGFPVWSGWRRR
jgi:hypothetical protein